MSQFHWRPFMTRWSLDMMASELAERVSPPPQSPDWLGFDPAGKPDLEELEDRLGMSLPPSYRSFLLVSNGWRRTTFAIDYIRPAAEVEWFGVENEHWVDTYSGRGSELADEAYYDYSQGSASDYRAEHMKSLIQISDVDDGVYLLNPEAATPDGEWEAWFFANWVPGAVRYPSFAHLMVQQYLSFARQNHVKVSPSEMPPMVISGPEVPRVPAERARKKAVKAPTIEELIVHMRQLEGRPLDLALRTFTGKMRGRRSAERRPELVPVLVDLYHSSSHAGVRSACVSAITELADDPPPLLLESLSDPDPWVTLWGFLH